VLVLDVADHHLDEILDRDETVGTAIFIDHQRHVSAGRLHADEKIDGRHRARHEQDRPQNPRGGKAHRQVDPAEAGRQTGCGRDFVVSVALATARRPRIGPHGEEIEEVADVHHALRVVEGLAIDRQARMAGGAEQGQEVAKTRVGRNSDDVRARDHHVVDPDSVEAEHVFEHRPLLGRKVPVLGARGEHVLEVVADGIPGFQVEAMQEAFIPAFPCTLRLGKGSCRSLDATSIVIHNGCYQPNASGAHAALSR